MSRTDKSGQVVAFCGTRGLPAGYGGFETAVDEITQRFVDWGHRCDVFCRRSSSEDELPTHRGRHLIYVKGSRLRTLETFISSIQTGWSLWRRRRRYRHAFWFNNANLPGIIITLLAGIPVTVNTDGLEWRRAKWSWPFKAYYYVSSWLVSRLCRSLITDSRNIADYYRGWFGKASNFVPYGAPSISPASQTAQREILKRYGLQPGRYYLQITRFEPDNLPLHIALAFRRARLAERGFRMVFVGYKESTPYADRLMALSGRQGIEVNEAIYEQAVLDTLRRNCHCYIHGNCVGGTNPALLEAMATCPRVMAIDCPFSHEVLGDTGLFFDKEAIDSTLRWAVTYQDNSTQMQQRVRSLYQWDAVAEAYVRLAEGKAAEYCPRPADADHAALTAPLEEPAVT
jgi:glycosyltransferase involved in cell wall biosynthesis